MSAISVIDPFNVVHDAKMPFLAQALHPEVVQQQFDRLSLWQNTHPVELQAIRVIRYKPGRRCLIEYDVVENQSVVTLIGKARAKGLDHCSFRLLQLLWHNGFDRDSCDRISVPEPIGVIPQLQMWLQRKIAGTVTTNLLPQSSGIALSQQIAQAAYKLHQANIVPRRSHTMADELQILRDRLGKVVQLYPHLSQRIERLLMACDRLGAATPELDNSGIHRDFYPDQVLVAGDRIYLLDLDLYCIGTPSLDIGNFIAHVTEQSLRTLGNADALIDREEAAIAEFTRLSSSATRVAIQAYKTLSLARHIYISTLFPERQRFTETLLELCEQRLCVACHCV
ncbi:phosphotransferase [Gloeocapsopsis dulcis]|uniref:Aminoglycoside phosphotransferase n=1 Tax=Gloeocapsopsis dulcis AAB1 = 1H9 TaxID=1433147 RepID=A0A6N8FSR5_9CHRO|nr:phosphotransferase [Gloeocapsopsis dulcis]MUL34986.1 aminoglycoside phosphotransferase [Gloeocapsopsis dulcis AAB1 = 1H9]WNN89939.1 phosphotransferase [Gloeocapsopsis dulcis]